MSINFKSIKEKLSSKNRELNLDDLYSMTKYGVSKSEEQIKNHLIKCINEQIQNKIRNHNYTLILDLMGDIDKYKDFIVDHYEKLNLTCQIINVELKKVNKTANYLLITWIK